MNPWKRSCRVSGVWFLEPKLSHWSDWSECKTETLEGAEPIRDVLKSPVESFLTDSFIQTHESKKRRERFCVRKQQQHFAYGNIPTDTVIDQQVKCFYILLSMR